MNKWLTWTMAVCLMVAVQWGLTQRNQKRHWQREAAVAMDAFRKMQTASALNEESARACLENQQKRVKQLERLLERMNER